MNTLIANTLEDFNFCLPPFNLLLKSILYNTIPTSNQCNNKTRAKF